MAPYSVLVTGANRGIGLALVKEFLKNKDIGIVIATTRNPEKAKVNLMKFIGKLIEQRIDKIDMVFVQ